MNGLSTGEKIYRYRKEAGLSQEELAFRVGVSRQTVSRWEQGMSFPDGVNISGICKALGISAEQLICPSDTDGTLQTCECAQDIESSGCLATVDVSADIATECVKSKGKSRTYAVITIICIAVIIAMVAVILWAVLSLGIFNAGGYSEVVKVTVNNSQTMINTVIISISTAVAVLIIAVAVLIYCWRKSNGKVR